MKKYKVFLNFNSIKVRLKLLSLIMSIIFSLFQFHKGTIKTDIDKNEYYIEDISIP